MTVVFYALPVHFLRSSTRSLQKGNRDFVNDHQQHADGSLFLGGLSILSTTSPPINKGHKNTMLKEGYVRHTGTVKRGLTFRRDVAMPFCDFLAAAARDFARMSTSRTSRVEEQGREGHSGSLPKVLLSYPLR